MSEDNPVIIRFFNDDVVSHEIHADADLNGFGHGQGPIAPGAMDPVVRRVTAPGTYDYYPHDLGPSILGRVVIE
jgi:plastocyanin